MSSLLRDLYGHQAWADVQQWLAVEAHPGARDDQILRNRLHHIHYVQRSFIWTVGDRAEPFTFSKPEDFETLDALKTFARGAHAEIDRFITGVTEERLAQPVLIPWFQERPLTISIAEALMQAAMHSQWHRGQNATRLRELGATPPTLDLIVWYWMGRPRADWDAPAS